MMGILLPSLGPWLGLNVAAIQPNHSHIYLGDHAAHHHDLFLDRILPHAHPTDDVDNSVVSIPTTDILNNVYSLYLLFFLGTVLFGYHDTYSGKVENRKGFVKLFNFSPPYPPPRFPLLSNQT
jgi:hypothetical protein